MISVLLPSVRGFTAVASMTWGLKYCNCCGCLYGDLTALTAVSEFLYGGFTDVGTVT